MYGCLHATFWMGIPNFAGVLQSLTFWKSKNTSSQFSKTISCYWSSLNLVLIFCCRWFCTFYNLLTLLTVKTIKGDLSKSGGLKNVFFMCEIFITDNVWRKNKWISREFSIDDQNKENLKTQDQQMLWCGIPVFQILLQLLLGTERQPRYCKWNVVWIAVICLIRWLLHNAVISCIWYMQLRLLEYIKVYTKVYGCVYNSRFSSFSALNYTHT